MGVSEGEEDESPHCHEPERAEIENSGSLEEHSDAALPYPLIPRIAGYIT